MQIRDIINEEMEALWNGSKSADKALDDAAARGNKLLRKFERTNKRQRTPPNDPRRAPGVRSGGGSLSSR